MLMDFDRIGISQNNTHKYVCVLVAAIILITLMLDNFIYQRQLKNVLLLINFCLTIKSAPHFNYGIRRIVMMISVQVKEIVYVDHSIFSSKETINHFSRI